MEEIWKDIEGYEGLYQVSNLGNVRSLDRIVNCKNGRKYQQKGCVLRAGIGGVGYYTVALNKNGKSKTYNVHRLVAEAFIPNHDNLLYINHRDENKLNNHVNNLEWVTCKYNIDYSNVREKSIEVCSKPVIKYTKSGQFLNEYKSAKEASKQTGIYKKNISRVCRGERKSAGGYLWRYKEKSDV